MDASIHSNTPVTAYLEMPVVRFFEIWRAICAVYERKNKNGGQTDNSPPRPQKAKKRRRR